MSMILVWRCVGQECPHEGQEGFTRAGEPDERADDYRGQAALTTLDRSRPIITNYGYMIAISYAALLLRLQIGIAAFN
jgi:hypothetical protein